MNNELQHHGILGMPWGIRRFQNKDGSLTSAGKERYKDDKANNKSTGKKVATGIAIGIGTAAIAAGAAYAIKISNMKTKDLFGNEVFDEMKSFIKNVENSRNKENALDLDFIKKIKRSSTFDGMNAIRNDPLRAARLMSDMDWNKYKAFIPDRETYGFIFDTMRSLNRFD